MSPFFTAVRAVIFTAPSGAGKTTIVHHLLRQYSDCLGFSISATTRPPRPGERHGVDYYFIPVEEFRRRVQTNAFLEWEEVYPNTFYGTLRTEVDRLWQSGKVALFDIDVKGALSIKEALGDRALAVFVHPPDIDSLFQRLRRRNTEASETVQLRLQRAKEELRYRFRFDIVLYNDDLQSTLRAAERIVQYYVCSNSFGD